MEIAQTPVLMKRGANLEQQVQFSASPLSGQMYPLLGRVQFQAELLVEPAEMGDIPSPYVEGRTPIPEDAQHTDGSYHGMCSEMMGAVLDLSLIHI